jgi:YhcH/YjgK/YiaL family protein
MYYNLNKNFEKAFDFIKEYNLNRKEVGRYDIDGEVVYAMVMDCELKDKGRLETHKKYIDIQYIAVGEEVIAVANRDLLKVEENLLDEKDVIFYEDSNLKSNVKFKCGDFAIFFLQDAHEPCLKLNGSEKATKIVVKVLV